VCEIDAGVDGTLLRLIEPKPLNSGTSTEARCGGSLLAMLLDMLSNTMAEPRGATGVGEPNAARVLLGVGTLLSLFWGAEGVSACCFSGEIDRARS
jgi:hypothetical protein